MRVQAGCHAVPRLEWPIHGTISTSDQRASGILLHPTSLRTEFGIGDLGPAAHEWVDFVADTGTTLWQILPLGPTGYGDSPYQCFSTFAGNPYLISPTLLLADGLVTQADLDAYPDLPTDYVDFGPVITAKLELLDAAFARFQAVGVGDLRDEYEIFRVQNTPPGSTTSASSWR